MYPAQIYRLLLSADTDGTTDEDIVDRLEDLKGVSPEAIESYLEGKVPTVIGFLINVIIALIVIFIATRFIKLLRKIVRRTLERSNADTGVVQFVDSFTKVACYILLFIVVLGFFGIETTSFITVFGTAGLTVGLALQGSLSNFAGGVLIMILKPFTVGDFITFGDNEGTVTRITLFATTYLTIDNRAVVVPNGDLANSTIINVTAEKTRRVIVSTGISYNADLRRAKEVMRQVYEADEDVLKDKDIEIFVDELADSAVILTARGWVEQEHYWPAKWRLTENVKLAFDEEGIEIPFNQVDVHIK